MERAYSVLIVKALDEETREFSGIATTPEVDRMGDQIVTEGIEFAMNPAPLLWQHRHDSPVGNVTFEPPTKEGIAFSARIPKVTEPGAVKDRTDEAWHSIKHGLVKAVSIGLMADTKHIEKMKSGGRRVLRSIVHELSLVTIGANGSALITAVKALDVEALAASGHKRGGVRLTPRPGVSGDSKPTTRPGTVALLKGQ